MSKPFERNLNVSQYSNRVNYKINTIFVLNNQAFIRMKCISHLTKLIYLFPLLTVQRNWWRVARRTEIDSRGWIPSLGCGVTGCHGCTLGYRGPRWIARDEIETRQKCQPGKKDCKHFLKLSWKKSVNSAPSNDLLLRTIFVQFWVRLDLFIRVYVCRIGCRQC